MMIITLNYEGSGFVLTVVEDITNSQEEQERKYEWRRLHVMPEVKG